MADQPELTVYDYVNRPYADVRDALMADPVSTFKEATTRGGQATGAELHGHAGPVEVGAEIAIEVLSVEETVTPSGRGRSTIALEWKAARRPGLFPTMHANLLVYPLTPTETQLELEGSYDPPFGVIGEVIDAVAMRRIAEETVTTFIQAVADYLRERPTYWEPDQRPSPNG